MKQCAVAIFVLLWLAPTMVFAQANADAGEHDVPWTPNAATLQFVYCRSMDVDWRKLATTEVFEATLPPAHDVTQHQALSRYAVDFGASVVAADAGADDRPLCIASDTRVDAAESRRDYRNAFAFARIKTIDMAWMPGQTPLVVPATAAVATPVATAVATMGGVVEDAEPGFWRRISDSKRIEDFDDYLVAYPQGRHAAIAHLEAKRLRQELLPPRVVANGPVIAMAMKDAAAKHLPQEVAPPRVTPSDPVIAMATKDAAKRVPQEIAPPRVTPSDPVVAMATNDAAAQRLLREVASPRAAPSEPVIAMATKDAAKDMPQEIAPPRVTPSEPIVAMATKNDVAKHMPQEVASPRAAPSEPVIAMATKDVAKHLPKEIAPPRVTPSGPVVAMAVRNAAAKPLPQEVAPLRVTPGEPGVTLPAKDEAAALAQPGDAALAKRIATEPFFQVPVGSGAIAMRSGSHIVNETVSVASRITARRVAGGNLCQLDYNSDAGASATFKTKAAGVTWAGLIPLQLASQINSPYALISGTNRTLTIDTAEGQPFPLVEGHTFAYSYTQSNVDDAIGTTTMTLAQDCKVGATGPASATIPGMAGAQTEVHCRMRFGNPAIPPQDSVMHWYSAVGCFVQDPAR